MNMDENTKQIIHGIKWTCLTEDEMNFWQLRELFVDEIDIPRIVNVFKKCYDSEFTFAGSAKELYQAIQQWFYENIG